jgi:ankyrin repeat protein
MLAARNGHVEAARTLLYEDPDLGHKGPNGETALAIATARRHTGIVELLRRAGAVE